MKSILIFGIRQIFLLAFLVILDYYRVETVIIQKENDYIESTINKEYPFLKYRNLIGLVSVGTFFVLSSFELDSNDARVEFIFYLASCLFYVYVSSTIFRMSILVKHEHLTDFYNIKKSVKYHGVRSFSTASKVAHLCRLCGGAGLALVSCAYVAPKIIEDDAGARGSFVNWVSERYSTHGIKANHADTYRLANRLLDYDPSLKANVCDENNNVYLKKVVQQYDKLGMKKPASFGSVVVEHSHEVGLKK